MSHRITSHHITSHHITSHHITSHHITSRHLTSHHPRRTLTKGATARTLHTAPSSMLMIVSYETVKRLCFNPAT